MSGGSFSAAANRREKAPGVGCTADAPDAPGATCMLTPFNLAVN